MKVRALSVVAASLLVLVGAPAWAHDLEQFDRVGEPKPIPVTCEQLADPMRFSNDVAIPEVGELKERCEAQKKMVERARNAVPPKQKKN